MFMLQVSSMGQGVSLRRRMGLPTWFNWIHAKCFGVCKHCHAGITQYHMITHFSFRMFSMLSAHLPSHPIRRKNLILPKTHTIFDESTLPYTSRTHMKEKNKSFDAGGKPENETSHHNLGWSKLQKRAMDFVFIREFSRSLHERNGLSLRDTELQNWVSSDIHRTHLRNGNSIRVLRFPQVLESRCFPHDLTPIYRSWCK